MLGEYDIIVSSKKVNYELTVNRKFTILQGNSGSGKTRLFNCIMDELGEYKVECTVPLVAVPTARAFEAFARSQKDEECIYVIDENVCSVFQKRDMYHSFAKLAYSMSGYFILISRSEIPALPYSPEAILILEGVKVGNKYMNKAVRRYNWSDDNLMYPDKIIVEDLKSGFQFYDKTLRCDVVSADGNSNISKKLKEVSEEHIKNIYVVGDGAGIGAFVNSIFGAKEYAENSGRNVKLFFPESFEYLLLNVLLKNKDVLYKTYLYADTSSYKSWEEFYFDYLKELLHKRYRIKYAKSEIPSFMLSRKFVTKFYNGIEDLDKSCIK